MFYDLFKELCDQKGISVSKACIEIGLSRSIAAKWKNTKTNPSAEVLPKIAEYFGVTIDYLLTGKEATIKGKEALTLDDFTYAMHGESGKLSDKDKEILLSMARQLAAAHEKKVKDGETD